MTLLLNVKYALREVILSQMLLSYGNLLSDPFSKALRHFFTKKNQLYLQADFVVWCLERMESKGGRALHVREDALVEYQVCAV